MAGLPTTKSFAEYPWRSLLFGQALIAKSQTAVALKLNVNDATSGLLDLTGYVMPFAGSIVGVVMQIGANKTAGTFTCTPTKNGTAITAPAAITAVSMGNTTAQKYAFTDAKQAGNTFAAGDVIGAKITTDGSFAPDGTKDLSVEIYVVLHDVQV